MESTPPPTSIMTDCLQSDGLHPDDEEEEQSPVHAFMASPAPHLQAFPLAISSKGQYSTTKIFPMPVQPSPPVPPQEQHRKRQSQTQSAAALTRKREEAIHIDENHAAEKRLEDAPPEKLLVRWSPDEDAHLLSSVASGGKKWSVIAKGMEGRTQKAVRNRYIFLQRRRGEQRESAALVPPPPPEPKHAPTHHMETSASGFISWVRRGYRNKIAALFDLMDNCDDSALKASSLPSSKWITVDGCFSASDRRPVLVVTNGADDVRPIGECLTFASSKKSGTPQIGENGVGLKQSIVHLASSGLIVTRRKDGVISAALVSMALNVSDDVPEGSPPIFPRIEFECPEPRPSLELIRERLNGKDLGSWPLTRWTRYLYGFGVAESIYNAVEQVRECAGRRCGMNFKKDGDGENSFRPDEDVYAFFRVMLMKDHNEVTSIQIDDVEIHESDAPTTLFTRLEPNADENKWIVTDPSKTCDFVASEFPARYMDTLFSVSLHVEGRNVLPQQWHKMYVNFSRYKLELESHEKPFDVYMGYCPKTLATYRADNTGKKDKECRMYVLSRGRLVSSISDYRKICKLHGSNETDYQMGLTVILVDVNNMLTLDPTKEGFRDCTELWDSLGPVIQAYRNLTCRMVMGATSQRKRFTVILKEAVERVAHQLEGLQSYSIPIAELDVHELPPLTKTATSMTFLTQGVSFGEDAIRICGEEGDKVRKVAEPVDTSALTQNRAKRTSSAPFKYADQFATFSPKSTSSKKPARKSSSALPSTTVSLAKFNELNENHKDLMKQLLDIKEENKKLKKDNVAVGTYLQEARKLSEKRLSEKRARDERGEKRVEIREAGRQPPKPRNAAAFFELEKLKKENKVLKAQIGAARDMRASERANISMRETVQEEILGMYPRGMSESLSSMFRDSFPMFDRAVRSARTDSDLAKAAIRLEAGIDDRFKCRRWVGDWENAHLCRCNRCTYTRDHFVERLEDPNVTAKHVQEAVREMDYFASDGFEVVTETGELTWGQFEGPTPEYSANVFQELDSVKKQLKEMGDKMEVERDSFQKQLRKARSYGVGGVLAQASSAPPSAVAPKSAVSRTPTNVDSFEFLQQAKEELKDRPQVYNEFLNIMKKFMAQTIDIPEVISRVSTLFRGHDKLCVGFNAFLPEGYSIEPKDFEGQSPTFANAKVSKLSLLDFLEKEKKKEPTLAAGDDAGDDAGDEVEPGDVAEVPNVTPPHEPRQATAQSDDVVDVPNVKPPHKSEQVTLQSDSAPTSAADHETTTSEAKSQPVTCVKCNFQNRRARENKYLCIMCKARLPERSFTVATKILARHKHPGANMYSEGGRFYKGFISSVNADGTYGVSYNDGDKSKSVLLKDIKVDNTIDQPRRRRPPMPDISMGVFPIGTKVTHNFKRRGYGICTGVVVSGKEKSSVVVRWNEGEDSTLTWSGFLKAKEAHDKAARKTKTKAAKPRQTSTKPAAKIAPKRKAGSNIIGSPKRMRTYYKRDSLHCGQCGNCKDMKKFGGPGKLKKACIARSVIEAARPVPNSPPAKRKPEKAAAASPPAAAKRKPAVDAVVSPPALASKCPPWSPAELDAVRAYAAARGFKRSDGALVVPWAGLADKWEAIGKAKGFKTKRTYNAIKLKWRAGI